MSFRNNDRLSTNNDISIVQNRVILVIYIDGGWINSTFNDWEIGPCETRYTLSSNLKRTNWKPQKGGESKLHQISKRLCCLSYGDQQDQPQFVLDFPDKLVLEKYLTLNLIKRTYALPQSRQFPGGPVKIISSIHGTGEIRWKVLPD